MYNDCDIKKLFLGLSVFFFLRFVFLGVSTALQYLCTARHWSCVIYEIVERICCSWDGRGPTACTVRMKTERLDYNFKSISKQCKIIVQTYPHVGPFETIK